MRINLIIILLTLNTTVSAQPDYFMHDNGSFPKTVLRVINLQLPENKALDSLKKAGSLYQTLSSVLLEYAKSDSIKLYSLNDSSFALTLYENSMEQDSIDSYLLLEGWFFDKENHKMTVKIMGIAPAKSKKSATTDSISYKPVFWIKYPGIRKILQGYFVPDINTSGQINCDDYVENRHFSNTILKISRMIK